MEKRHALLGILIAYIIIVIVGAVISIPGNITVVSNNDKLIHFFEFFVFAILMFKTLQSYKFKHIYLAGISLGVAFMIFSELIQGFVPSRSVSFYDFFSDMIGFFLGMGVFRWIFYKL